MLTLRDQSLQMKKYCKFLSVVVILAATSCRTVKNTATAKEDGKIEVTFVQVNDVYEIAPVENGKEGGMARVATIKKEYKRRNPNTFLVMAGDFVSPSVYNSLQYNGVKIRGAQMIDAMNAAGMDLAVFGNHEFDISEKELQSRINESKFGWVASNTFHKTNDSIVPFKKVDGGKSYPFPESYIMTLRDGDGTTAKVGFIGLTISSNPAEFVSYTNPLTSAQQLYNHLKDSVDVVVAITHQTVAADIELAKKLPNLAVILGGHEHYGVFQKTGNVYITKAKSNARTAYIVKLSINTKKHTVIVSSKAEELNEKVSLDSTTDVVVQKWKKIAEDNYSSLGFDPKKIVLPSGSPLDGRETEIRSKSTSLTRLVTEAMAFACPKAEAVIFNAGSIRLDDILTPPVSQYDIIRSLPFGGGIQEADMKGSLLLQVLQAGMKNRGAGGFLQTQPIVFNNSSNTFIINGFPINNEKTYRVALTDFLISGKEANLSFLNPKNPDIKMYPSEPSTSDPKSDIRLAIIKYLESKK